jgi:hypothetical protein
MFGIESVCAFKEFVVSFNKYFFAQSSQMNCGPNKTITLTYLIESFCEFNL